MQTLFWICFFLIVIHYVLFGVLVAIAGIFAKEKEQRATKLPTISFIVAAYNEERIIKEKIQNLFSMDYPEHLIEFLIVSDGSSDKTPAIVSSFKHTRLQSLYSPERKGKTHALNRAIAKSQNEILIFSDANSMFRPNALKEMVKHFEDETIGGVCGRKAVLHHDRRAASIGDKLYWEYESAIKAAESKLGSIPTADGEIFAVRKKLYKEIPSSFINDDMAITFNIIKEGKRVIYEKMAITEEEASISLRDDFNVKSRMVYGGIQAIFQYKDLLHPLKSWFGLQFFFHKTLRYFMWAVLTSIFILTIICYRDHYFYKAFFRLQAIFYAIAATGFFLDKKEIRNKFFYLPYYYCNVNIAAMKGLYLFFKKESLTKTWAKAER